MTVKTPMTPKGVAILKTTLNRLKTEERPRLIQAIKEARAHGDLKENAEYHAIKEQQGLVEAKIRDIESKLTTANIIDVAQLEKKNLVVFGATVTIENLISYEKYTYQIVGDDEADVKMKKISINSPLARALIGKKTDDIAAVTTANGIVKYVLLKIEYI